MATYEGTIKSYGAKKGWGFITCAEVEGDVYVNCKALPTEFQFWDDSFFQLKDKVVRFELAHSADGKPQAKDVQFSLEGEELLIGLVKSFNATKGFGFISGSCLVKDVYFHGRDVPAALQGMDLKDMPVTFTVVETADGNVQARQVSFAATSGKGAGPNGKAAGKGPGMDAGKGAMGMGGPMDFMAMMMGGGPPEGAGMMGMVKSFDTKKGYGFINTPAFPGDVYFQGYAVMGGEPIQGMPVWFTLKWAKDGKPQASEVYTSPGGPAMMYGMEGKGKGGKGAASDMGGCGWGATGGATGGAAGGETKGTIKSLNPGNGYGFIAVPGMQPDVYFKVQNLPENLQALGESAVGRSVSFEVVFTADGKPQCKNCKLVGGGAVPSKRAAPSSWSEPPVKRHRVMDMTNAPPAGVPLEGIVKSFNKGKGWGFIVSESVQQDVYFQAKNCAPSLQHGELAGASVSFTLKYALDGKPQAEDVKEA